MPNDKRNRQQESGNENTGPDMQNQQGAEQAVSNEADDNPQRGDSWNNYQTRELSGGSDSGENFYRNRERGNYEEGSGSDDDGGGGSLY